MREGKGPEAFAKARQAAAEFAAEARQTRVIVDVDPASMF
jgi:hypothetical protein